MPRFQYTDVHVKLDGSGVLAESAELISNNSLAPFYYLGGALTNDANVTFPTMFINGPINNSISLRTIMQSNYPYGLNKITFLKGSILTTQKAQEIEIGGISGEGYLTRFTLSVNQNSPVYSNAVYAVYKDFSGQLASKNLGSQVYGVSNISGIAHGYTTFITSTSNYNTGKIYDLNYECNLTWNPMYNLGRRDPTQVSFSNGSEKISFVRDIYTGIQFSGQSLTGYFNLSDTSIDFYGLGYLNGATNNLAQLSLNGMTITNTKVDIVPDDFVKVQIEAERYF